MINLQQEIVNFWTSSRRTKVAAKGWITSNAVCCHHNGHSADSKGRGGLLPAEDDGISYHCFNCGFTASWKAGRRLSYKMRKLLQWMGLDQDLIQSFSLFALGNLDSSLEVRKEAIRELPTYPTSDPCPGKSIIDWLNTDIDEKDKQQLAEAVAYIESRGLSEKLAQFNWSAEESLRRRVLVPFSWLGNPVGYSSRLFQDGAMRYLKHCPSDFVFNYDRQLHDAKFCLVVEGLFDAVAVDGLAVLHNECSEQQALVIESLNRNIVVVADRDKAGLNLIKNSIEYGWNVAFPDWHDDIKDTAAAVERYGQLFTMKSILDSVETSNLKIQLMSKKWIRH